MSGQEIDRHGVWSRLENLLTYEAPLSEATDLAAALRQAALAADAGIVEGGEQGMARIAQRMAVLLHQTKADLETLRSEFANTAA